MKDTGLKLIYNLKALPYMKLNCHEERTIISRNFPTINFTSQSMKDICFKGYAIVTQKEFDDMKNRLKYNYCVDPHLFDEINENHLIMSYATALILGISTDSMIYYLKDNLHSFLKNALFFMLPCSKVAALLNYSKMSEDVILNHCKESVKSYIDIVNKVLDKLRISPIDRDNDATQKAESEKLKNENQNLKNEIKALKAKIKEIEKTNENYQAEIKEKDSTIKKNLEEIENKIDESSIESLSASLMTYHQRNKNLANEVKSLRANLEKAQNENAVLEGKLRNVSSDSNSTVGELFSAAERGDPRKVSEVLQYFKGKIKNNFDQTPLHFAAASGSEKTIKLLLDAGYRMDEKDKFGSTPNDWKT